MSEQSKSSPVLRRVNLPLLQKDYLRIDQCPHCSRAKPTLEFRSVVISRVSERQKIWCVYECLVCGLMVLAVGLDWDNPVTKIYPTISEVSSEIPELAREFLKQARDTASSPAASIMVACSSIDAMLKDKGINNPNLSAAINEATSKGVITKEMSAWAHDVRLDSNDPRHVKENPLPTVEDASRVIELTEALGYYMYILPSMVTRGHEAVKRSNQVKKNNLH